MNRQVDTERPIWFRLRRYLHFDVPVSVPLAKLIVSDPRKVANHAFYPFIYSTITSRKQSKDKNTRKVVWKIKEREVACSSHVDSHIYSFYSHQLGIIYENELLAKGIGDSVLAFRTLGKSNIDFALRAFETIKARQSLAADRACHAIALDIRGFFDNLDHERLKIAWSRILQVARLPPDHFNLYKSLTKWCKVEKANLLSALGISIHNPRKGRRRRLCNPEVFRKYVRGAGLLERNERGKGIPQGSPISAVLSNIYMLEFDEQMHAFARSIEASYFRYCDDMVIICDSGKRDECMAFAHSCIENINLEIQDEKTEESKFVLCGDKLVTEHPLQYLGFTFDGTEIRIRSGSIARYFDRMRRGVRLAKNTCAKYNEIRRSRAEETKSIYRKKIYRRYTYLGRRNFVSYGYRSAETMESLSVRRQLRPLWAKLVKVLKA